MQVKLNLLPLVTVASGFTLSGATPAWTTDVAIGGRTLVARTTTATRVTGTTLTVTKTVTKPPTNTGGSECNWCECFTAMAAEGVACAAAILEGGCNIIADISCIIDATAFAQAIPKCIACL